MDKPTQKNANKQDAAKNILLNLELNKSLSAAKLKNNTLKGYKPGDNRQVTHNLRRRMGR
jgi:hypothetical protein